MTDERLAIPDEGDELFFTAVRYALDELSPSAHEAFEERLMVDQQARECLAEAVAVCQSACDGLQVGGLQFVVEPAVAVESRLTADRLRSIVWTSLALAASVLLVVGLANFGKQGGLPVANLPQDESELAVAWVTSGEWVYVEPGRDGVVGHERRVPADDLPENESDEADDEIAWLDGANEPLASDGANDWLFEAVTIPQAPSAKHQEG